MIVKSVFLLLLWLQFYSPLMGQEYFYTETTENKSTDLQITKRQTTDGAYMITMKDNYRDSRHYFQPEGYTVRWQHSDARVGDDFDVVRKGDQIAIKGTLQGKPINKTVEIDESIWINKVDHALSNWVKSDDDAIDFWILKLSADLDPLKINAKKVGEETLNLDGKSFQTIKVKLTLCGFFLSHLWSSYYWYRKEDGLFLKFKGALGTPGTPLTTIEYNPSGD